MLTPNYLAHHKAQCLPAGRSLWCCTVSQLSQILHFSKGQSMKLRVLLEILKKSFSFQIDHCGLLSQSGAFRFSSAFPWAHRRAHWLSRLHDRSIPYKSVKNKSNSFTLWVVAFIVAQCSTDTCTHRHLLREKERLSWRICRETNRGSMQRRGDPDQD